MKVLITGGGGYVGSAVATSLVRTNHEVEILDPFPLGFNHLVPYVAECGLKITKGSILNETQLREAVKRSDLILNLAAIVGEHACKESPQSALTINCNGAVNVATICSEFKKPFIFFSTCSNYGKTESSSIVDEDSPLQPLGLYAESKVRAESLIFQVNESSVCLRLATACGVSPRMRFDLLVNEMVLDAIQKRETRIYSESAWRPFVSLSDIAGAVETIIHRGVQVFEGQIFNIVGENCQKRDLVSMVRSRFPDHMFSTINSDTPDLRDYRVSGDRFTKLSGFVPKFSLEQVIDQIIAYLQDRVSTSFDSEFYRAIIPTDWTESG